MTRIWFTADTHFGHRAVIPYTGRPFADVEEMDAELVRRWNYLVGPRDDVYHLGDFALCKPVDGVAIARRLNGRIHLIKGNHDHRKSLRVYRREGVFSSIEPYAELKVPDPTLPRGRAFIVLSHYAFAVWRDHHYGSWHLHGHSHGSLPSPANMRRLDVGVDVHAFAPISYEEVRALLSTRATHVVDHHGRPVPA